MYHVYTYYLYKLILILRFFLEIRICTYAWPRRRFLNTLVIGNKKISKKSKENFQDKTNSGKKFGIEIDCTCTHTSKARICKIYKLYT